MALGNPFNIGSTAQASGVSTTVVTAGTDANGDSTTMPSAGNSLFVLIGYASSSVTVSSVTDSRGNTYTLATNGKFQPTIGQTCVIYECLNPAATLVSTNTVTVTWSATTTFTTNVRVIGCAGVASSSADDQSGTTSATGTSGTVTASGALAQASELAVAVFQSGNATGGISSWGTFTQMGHNLHSGSGSYFGVATVDTTSTTTPSTSATFATSGNYAGLLLTFKASTSGAGGLSIVNTSPLPAGQVGVAYSDQLTATGGITPYTWSVTAGSLPAGLTLEPGGGSGGSGDFTYVGANCGPQGGPTINQLNATKAVIGPVGTVKYFYSAGGSGIYTGLLGGDVNGGSWSTADAGTPGYSPATITAAIPGVFINVNWGAKMSTSAINQFVKSIPTSIAEVGFNFQSEMEAAYPLTQAGGTQFISDWTDQANKIRAAQALTPVKLTLIVSSIEEFYQNGQLTQAWFIPPASVVDVYGLDFYDRKGFWVGSDMSTNKAWTVWTGLVKGLGKPLALTEYGISGATAADQNTRLQADLAYLKSAFGPGGSISQSPLYIWLYWNTDGTSLSTTSSSPDTPPGGKFNINQLLSTAAQNTWAGIAALQGGSGATGTGGGGLLAGTPTTAATSTPTIQVKDSAGTTSSTAFSITISASSALAISNATPLPGATASTAYTTQLTATGGTAPYSWSLQTGTLPTGLAISGQTITGTPTGGAGTSSFTLKVTDNVAATATQATSITVAAAPSITTTTIPNGQVGTAYSQTITGTGGTTPYTWGISSGVLPDGLTLDQTAGTIAGTPNVSGAFPITVQLTDAANATATQAYPFAVAQSFISGVPAIGRRRFGGGESDWTFTFSGSNLVKAPNVTLSFWTALTGGSQITDLQTTGGGAITTVTSDSNGNIGEFFGPAGTWRMAADANGGAGPRVWMNATDIGDYITTLRTYLVSVAGG